MATCKKFERCPFSPKNAFKLKKSREEIKYEFYFFILKYYIQNLCFHAMFGVLFYVLFFLLFWEGFG